MGQEEKTGGGRKGNRGLRRDEPRYVLLFYLLLFLSCDSSTSRDTGFFFTLLIIGYNFFLSLSALLDVCIQVSALCSY